MENKKYVYIVLIKALTNLGKFSRRISRYDYTHIAVSFNEDLKDFVTFSRKKHYSPFDAGFMHEKIENYAFGKNNKVKVKIFKIPISNENKVKIIEYILKIENDKDYIFNLYSMLTMPIFHGIKIYKALNCMSFVSKIIELTDSIKMEKEYYKYSIKDIDDLLKKFLLKECYLKKDKDDIEYMERVGILVNLKMFFKLNGKLIYRLIFKRNENYE